MPIAAIGAALPMITAGLGAAQGIKGLVSGGGGMSQGGGAAPASQPMPQMPGTPPLGQMPGMPTIQGLGGGDTPPVSDMPDWLQQYLKNYRGPM